MPNYPSVGAPLVLAVVLVDGSSFGYVVDLSLKNDGLPSSHALGETSRCRNLKPTPRLRTSTEYISIVSSRQTNHRDGTAARGYSEGRIESISGSRSEVPRVAHLDSPVRRCNGSAVPPCLRLRAPVLLVRARYLQALKEMRMRIYSISATGRLRACAPLARGGGTRHVTGTSFPPAKGNRTIGCIHIDTNEENVACAARIPAQMDNPLMRLHRTRHTHASEMRRLRSGLRTQNHIPRLAEELLDGAHVPHRRVRAPDGLAPARVVDERDVDGRKPVLRRRGAQCVRGAAERAGVDGAEEPAGVGRREVHHALDGGGVDGEDRRWAWHHFRVGVVRLRGVGLVLDGLRLEIELDVG
uniref:Uncharacterized protein n=1 Tax=Mycena chlorophos TaxID=658473 RepID=A0ABQ0LWH3_MYCCL|nr:predicted protein [Mycena chlorophos]